jgi:hypothetical protein
MFFHVLAEQNKHLHFENQQQSPLSCFQLFLLFTNDCDTAHSHLARYVQQHLQMAHAQISNNHWRELH